MSDPRPSSAPAARRALPSGAGAEAVGERGVRDPADPRPDPGTTTSSHLSAGEGIAPHRHEEHQVVYASRGVVAVVTGDRSWVAPPNRAIWIPAGTVHHHRMYGRTHLHTLGLAGDDPLGPGSPAILAVSPLLRELVVTYTAHPAEDSGRRRRLRAVILDELRTTRQEPLRVPVPRDPRLATVCDLLLADPADPRPLPELAATAAVGPRTLSRLFREELGMTFPQWRTQLRLQLALRLLAEGRPITAVAHRCGWATSSAFTDVFRRTLGVTPTQALEEGGSTRPGG